MIITTDVSNRRYTIVALILKYLKPDFALLFMMWAIFVILKNL